MPDDARLLPDVPIYGLIGGIPEAFGGRTSVCINRANAFAELDGRDMEILTFSPAHGVDPEAVTRRLQADGRIGDRVRIRNIWADLRRATDNQLRTLSAQLDGPEMWLTDPADVLAYDGESEAARTADGGKRLQTDRFRADGSRVTSYRIDTRDKGTVGGSAITLYSHAGQVVAQWEHQHALYFAWLDWVLGTDRVVLINDGPGLAQFLYEYRRDNVVSVQTIHSRHSSDPRSPAGTLSIKYRPMLTHMEWFDRVAVLTQAQRKDMLAQHYAVDNIEVLPNMFVPSSGTGSGWSAPVTAETDGLTAASNMAATQPRDRTDGVMLARLSYQKRIDHAVTAIHQAQQQGTPARLEVFGVPDDAEESLTSLIADLGLDETVRLAGFDPHAKDAFAQASFTLLTSQFEGQSLVLLEAMAAGCIPIAYDLDYGPSDVITDGVNGFLVPNGDTAALSERIRTLATMAEADVQRMRQAAVARAQDFTPEVIVRRWGAMLSQAVADKAPVREITGKATLLTASADGDAFRIRVKISGGAADGPSWAMLMWQQRKGRGYGRVPARMEAHDSTLVAEAVIPVSSFAPYLRNSGVVEFWLDLRVHGNPARLRVKGAPTDLSVPADSVALCATKYHSLNVRATDAARQNQQSVAGSTQPELKPKPNWG